MSILDSEEVGYFRGLLQDLLLVLQKDDDPEEASYLETGRVDRATEDDSKQINGFSSGQPEDRFQTPRVSSHPSSPGE